MGTALKSLFGVSTESDTNILDEWISQVERWAEKQGAVFNTVIDAANANAEDIKSVVTFMNELSRNVQNLTLSAEQRQRFSVLAMDCLRHVSLHKEHIQALLNAHKGILSPALISPRQLQAIVDWTMGQNSHSPLVEDSMV